MRKITLESPVTLIELPPTQYGKLDGDTGYDIFSRFNLVARAIHGLEAILRKLGFKNVQSINPIYHGENGKLSKDNKKRIRDSDAVGISTITRTAPQSLEFLREIKIDSSETLLFSGGPDATYRTEAYLEDGDIVVRGEGERTLEELMKRLLVDSNSLDDIDGLAFKKNGEISVTKDRKLLTPEELSELPLPFYDEITRKRAQAVVETSRGCPNNCDFCGVTQFYGGKYRTKSLDYVLEAIRQTQNMWAKARFFSDDNLAGNQKRAIELFKAIEDSGLNNKNSVAQITVEAADNPELLRAMKNANVKAVCVGIESLNDETLVEYRKPYRAEQNKEAIKKLREAGFWVHGMMILGGDGDSLESLDETSEWINRNLDSAQLFSPIPLPGTRFYEKVKKEGRILTEDEDYSLYDGQHVVVRPKNISPYQLQMKINEMYKRFYSIGNIVRRFGSSNWKKMAVIVGSYARFEGLKKTIDDPQSRQHLKFLKSVG